MSRSRSEPPSGYAELRCKSNFTFLHGASHAEELANQAAALGCHALAITDVNTLAGVVRAHVAAKAVGLKLIVGAEIIPVAGPPVLLYAADLAGYRELSHLITRGRRAAPKGECHLHFSDLADHAEHVLAAVVPPEPGADEAQLVSALRACRELYGKRGYLAASIHLGPNDAARLEQQALWARQARLPLLAVNDVHYHVPARRPLQEVLTAIRLGTPVAELGAHRLANSARCLKSPRQMAELFACYPQALRATLELAERCTFSLDELRYDYPDEICPPGLAAPEYLARLTWEGARECYPLGVPEKVRTLLHRELDLIRVLRYEAFFLTVYDIVHFARSQGILCQGRGSAANSAVCFCLGITAVDPSLTDVLFERFISKERDEPPDIDVDFEHERREEVLQYVWRKYGRERAALVATVITYRPRSAVRDVGKALGFSLDAVDRLARRLDPHAGPLNVQARLKEAGLAPQSPQAKLLVELVRELVSFPRHLSQHVGGFVIARHAIADLVPTENAAMADRTVIQWDKNDAEALGLLKVDCLALGMLTAIRKCFGMVAQHQGQQLTLAAVPREDPEVYDMICRADTVGTFQIESRAQMSMLPRLRPRCFYDLVIEVAIVRPGPIQGGMVHPYLRRRNSEEPVTYPNPLVQAVLAKTLGVPLFQEQAMRLAVVAAGFTPGEADQFRRAMGAWKRTGTIQRFQEKLRNGMLARGLPAEFADQLYAQLRGFGEYGFPESHAASFAKLAYISAWLKRWHPAAFTAALLNSQPMGFYAPAQLVNDARAHGVRVLPPDVNHSAWDCTLEASAKGGLALRLGLRMLHGLAQAAGQAIAAARSQGGYRTLREVLNRAGVNRATLLRLAAADAFASLGLSRRQALWRALALHDLPPLFAQVVEDVPDVPLPEMSLADEALADYDAAALSLKAHPLGLLAAELAPLRVTKAQDLPAAQGLVRVAGLVLVRQRPPTANGTVFLTLEDETGMINLVVWRRVWERFRGQAQAAAALLAEGRVENTTGAIHVLPDRLEDLSQTLKGLATRSRDFR